MYIFAADTVMLLYTIVNMLLIIVFLCVASICVIKVNDFFRTAVSSGDVTDASLPKGT